jgi:hypothetical protein
MSASLIKQSVPGKYHSYITSEPTKVTKVIDAGIVAYQGESNVELVTYEYGTVKSSHTIILPALINRNDNGKLTQISVIIHW